ncbi:MAG: protein phosphatase CheZ [Pseudomonadota bacterium]
MDSNLPVINLELNSGVFRIKTPDAIYNITVTQDSSLAKVVEKVVVREVQRQEAPPAPTPRADSELEDMFFREISEEMYDEIGKLARQLSLSIKEIPGPTLKGVDIKKTGIELEDAKGQLEDIVQMTEKATMDIMDLAESIQEDLQEVESTLGSLKEMEFMTLGEKDLDWGSDVFEENGADGPTDLDSGEVTPAFLGMIIETETKLRNLIDQLPQAEALSAGSLAPPPAVAPAVAPPRKIIKKYSFDPDVVFQTLYELCTNETVKSHIKAMRGDQKAAFDLKTVIQTLSDLAPTADVEDNFFNFPITSILKCLFEAASNEKYKQVLKKMNQTAANIFLDAVLPVEGQVTEEEVELPLEDIPLPSPAPTGGAGVVGQVVSSETIQTLLDLIDKNLDHLEKEKKRLEDIGDKEAEPREVDPDFTQVKNEDRETIIHSVDGTDQIVKRITNHLTGIMEALSFQDLSGQRIFKIVRLISDVQIQLLSLLVAFGAKIKQKKEVQVVSPKEVEQLAQDEVDKMMEKISQAANSDLAGPGGEGRLDQDEVDKMLANLGF